MKMKSESLIQAAPGSLRPAVAALSRVVPRKPSPDGNLHILVEPVDRNTVRITGAGRGTFLSVDVPAAIPSAFGPFLVSFPGLQARLKGAGSHGTVEIQSGQVPAARFPELPVFRGASVTLEPKVAGAILRAFACASTDETRMVINGALLEVTGDGGNRVVGTDGRHLYAATRFVIPGLQTPVILPAHPVWKSPILRKASRWTLRVGGDASTAPRFYRIEAPGWSLTGRLTEGNYPNYHQVIPGPASFKAGAVLSERTLPGLEKLLETLPGGKSPHRPVGIRLGTKVLSILARETDEDAFGEHPVPSMEIHGDPVTVFIDRDYLAKAFRFGLNRIEIIDAVSAVKLSRDGELMIVMPVRCQGDTRAGTPGTPGVSPKESRREPVGKSPSPAEGSLGERPGKSRGGGPTGENQPDPFETVAMQVVQAREAIRLADSRLGDLATALRALVRKQRQAEKEMRAVRGTLRSLGRIEF